MAHCNLYHNRDTAVYKFYSNILIYSPNEIEAFPEISDKENSTLHLINASGMAAAHIRALQYDHCATAVQKYHRQLIMLRIDPR